MNRFIALVTAGLASIGVAMAAVNVNTASQEDLEALKDVGPVKARAIVEYRDQHGPFRSLRDLDKVPGVGKATIAAIKHDVTFSGPNTGVPAMKRDNRAEDRTDARAQRGTDMAAPERAARREETRDEKRTTMAQNDAGVIDINSASEKELKTLPGVGMLRAKAIVHGRPWRSKNELVDKHILPDHVYEDVKDRIVARHNPNDANRRGG